jgi:hypothetical protein
MAYPMACEGCEAGNHSEHIDEPRPLSDEQRAQEMCGGGFCPCQGQCEKIGGLKNDGYIFEQLRRAGW